MGKMQLPTIASKSAPIACALRIDPQAAELAVMIPTATLAAGYDQMLNSFLGGPRTEPAPPAEPAKE